MLMERLTVQAYGTDSLRRTMLKHEEIFKQQVNELHHLYRVQKELMTELKNKHQNNLHPFPGEAAMAAAAAAAETTSRIWSSPSASEDTTSKPCRKIAGSGSAQEQRSADNRRFDLERHTEDYTLRGGGSIEGGGPVSWPDDGSGVELTLSIGSGSDKKNKRKSAHWLHPNSDSDDGRQPLPAQPMMGPEKGEELKSPPWLLQAFRLSKT